MLSVIIIAKNEEKNIRRCLESVKWANELVVLDSGSVDNTIAIAKEYTDKVYSTDWQGYGVQKQRALDLATGLWVLNLDADESVDLELKAAIQAAMSSNSADAFRIPISMNFYGTSLRFSSSPQRHIRLFKRAGARYSTDIVHEKIILPPDLRISKIKNSIKHHCYHDVSHALYKTNCYSSYSAKIKIEKNKKSSFAKTLVGTAWMFFRCYFIQLGFLDGKPGFLMAVINTQGAFYRGIKQIYPDAKIDKEPKAIKDFN
ncbi:MAG: glycosyltransferase family 2 protein [Tatlockia sp.]|nr:glycosyltransferase family 2 protein [Tatlockia sp.]